MRKIVFSSILLEWNVSYSTNLSKIFKKMLIPKSKKNDRMANLGLIEFKLGLYIKVNVTAGLNKFEVHI